MKNELKENKLKITDLFLKYSNLLMESWVYLPVRKDVKIKEIFEKILPKKKE